MRRGRWVGDQRFRIAEIVRDIDQAELVEHGVGCGLAALDREGDERAAAIRQARRPGTAAEGPGSQARPGPRCAADPLERNRRRAPGPPDRAGPDHQGPQRRGRGPGAARRRAGGLADPASGTADHRPPRPAAGQGRGHAPADHPGAPEEPAA